MPLNRSNVGELFPCSESQSEEEEKEEEEQIEEQMEDVDGKEEEQRRHAIEGDSLV